MTTTVPMRYHMLIYRREQLWLPLGLWALFVLMLVLFRQEARITDITSSFLGVVLPLMGGILAAAALVEDPALELQLAAPRPPWRMLVERLVLLLGIIAVAALTYQVALLVAGVDIGHLGNLLQRQLVWLIPTLALMGLASLLAIVSVQSTVGVLGVGVIWLFQVIFHSWVAADPYMRYVFLFMNSMVPDSPDLLANQLCLLGLAAAFTAGAAVLLRREERYL
ncbi:MAG: hypothetical protein ACYC1C_09755 [Chloroflexota bacterium]